MSRLQNLVPWIVCFALVQAVPVFGGGTDVGNGRWRPAELPEGTLRQLPAGQNKGAQDALPAGNVSVKALGLITPTGAPAVRNDEDFTLHVELNGVAAFAEGTLYYTTVVENGLRVPSRLELPPVQGFSAMSTESKLAVEIELRVPARFDNTLGLEFNGIRIRGTGLDGQAIDTELEFSEPVVVKIKK